MTLEAADWPADWPTTVVIQNTGLRHRIVALGVDPRIVLTRCGIRAANVGGPFDRRSAYQRAVRKDEHPVWCGECAA